MESIPVGSINRKWTAPEWATLEWITPEWRAFLTSAAVGIIGAAILTCEPAKISFCDRKIRRVFLETLYLVSGGVCGKKPFDSAEKRKKMTEKMMTEGMDRKKLVRIGKKQECSLPDGSKGYVRETPANGDSFFSCVAVGLIEFLHANKDHFPVVIAAIANDRLLSKHRKEEGMDNLRLAVALEDMDTLEELFEDVEFMNQMILLLRSLMGSALEEGLDVLDEGRPSKKELYTEVLNSVASDPVARGIYSREKEFTPEAFEKMIRLIT